MSSLYTVDVDESTEIRVDKSTGGDGFVIRIGSGHTVAWIHIDYDKMSELSDKIRVAQIEHDYAIGKLVPDDGDGPVPGGAPQQIGS